MSWPIRGLSLDLRAQEVGRARAVKTGRFVRRGERTSSLIIMCEQAAPLQAGHLGPPASSPAPDRTQLADQQPDATHRGPPGFPARAELCLGLLQGGRADPAKITIRVMAITSLETRLP